MAPAAAPPVVFNQDSFKQLPEMQPQESLSTTSPTFEVTPPQPQDKSIKFQDKNPRTGSYEDAIDDNMEYESDEEHAQDWEKRTSVNDSWAVKERRRNSLFGKGPEPVNPHKDTGKERRGSILSQFKSTKDVNGNHVIASGFEDHQTISVPKTDKDTRSMSGSSAGNGRRGSILSMFTTSKDSKGRHHMNSGDTWEDMD